MNPKDILGSKRASLFRPSSLVIFLGFILSTLPTWTSDEQIPDTCESKEPRYFIACVGFCRQIRLTLYLLLKKIKIRHGSNLVQWKKKIFFNLKNNFGAFLYLNIHFILNLFLYVMTIISFIYRKTVH